MRLETLQSTGPAPSDERRREIADLGPWFHNLHLPDGLETAPDHPLGDFPGFKWAQIAPSIPANLSGWGALDIGCNAGFYCFELAHRGATVTGIDRDPHYLTQARWAAREFGLEDRVEFRRMQVYDLAHNDREFDLVLFMGVFYHLRYPLLGLDIVAEKVRHLMVFQTLTVPGEEVRATDEENDLAIDDRAALNEPGWPKMAFIEHRLAGDPTNWWAPNHTGVEAMLRSSGLHVIDRPGHEIYVCRPASASASRPIRRDVAEFLSATGRPWLDHAELS
jgi:tRNA (mo5U34)-methyltransferase